MLDVCRGMRRWTWTVGWNDFENIVETFYVVTHSNSKISHFNVACGNISENFDLGLFFKLKKTINNERNKKT